MSLNSQQVVPTPKYLVNPSDAEIDQAAKVLAAALGPDPFSPIITNGYTSHLYTQLRAGAGAAAAGGQLHVLTVGPEPTDIVGAACWFPPGTSVNSTPEQRAAGWDKYMEISTPEVREWWSSYFVPSMTQIATDTYGEGFTKYAWRLHLFGLLPAYQGKGYGKKLFHLAAAEAKETNSDIVLETTTDLDILIYRKLGLEVRAELPIESQGGKWKMFLMSGKAK